MESITPSYSIKDDRFKIEEIGTKELTLELQFSKLNILVKNENGQVEWLEDFNLDNIDTQIPFLWNNHTFLKAGYWRNIKVIVHSQNKQIVPTKYFSSDKPEEFLLYQNLEEYIVQSIKIGDQEQLVYAINKPIYDFLMSTYDAKKVVILPFEVFQMSKKDCTIIQLENHYCSILQVTNNELKDTITFRYDDSRDFERKLKKLSFLNIQKVAVAGEVTTYSQVYNLLLRMYGEVEFLKAKHSLKTTQYFNSIPQHKYYFSLNAQ